MDDETLPQPSADELAVFIRAKCEEQDEAVLSP